MDCSKLKHERFDYIDSLRGIAIAGVILTHAGSITKLEGWHRTITSIGGLGVQLFFVISAFTIFYSLSRAENNPHQLRDFFIKRFFRILPVYWFGIILYTLIFGLGSRGWREGPELWHYPIHFLLLNVFYPTTSSSVVPGGWSISCEIIFYLIVPFLCSIIKNKSGFILFMVFSTVLVPFLILEVSEIVNSNFFSSIDTKVQEDFWYRLPLNQLACFGFGIMLFKIHKDNKIISILSNKPLNLLMTVAVVGALLLLTWYRLLLPPKHHLYSFFFMVLALLLSIVPWKIFTNNLTVFLGKISYSCYLIHFLVIERVSSYIKMFFPQMTSDKIWYFVAVVVISFMVTIPLAYLCYRFIEKPSIKAGKTMINYLNEAQKRKKGVYKESKILQTA